MADPVRPIQPNQTTIAPVAQSAAPKPPKIDTVRAHSGGIQLGGTVVTSIQVGKSGVTSIVEDQYGVIVLFVSARPDKQGEGGRIRVPWSNIACVVYANE